jgi:hypothetical protein
MLLRLLPFPSLAFIGSFKAIATPLFRNSCAAMRLPIHAMHGTAMLLPSAL